MFSSGPLIVGVRALVDHGEPVSVVGALEEVSEPKTNGVRGVEADGEGEGEPKTKGGRGVDVSWVCARSCAIGRR
jgi:hypothetical protein